MNDLLIPVLAVLALIGGLMAFGLGALWLVVRTTRTRRLSAADDETWRQDFPQANPLTEQQARDIGASIRILNSAARGPGPNNDPT